MKINSLLYSIAVLFLTITAEAKPIEVILRLKERVSIETLAKNATHPSSARYQKYYSPEEIRDLSAPLQQDYQSLLATLKEKGFTVVRESKTHLFVTVRGDHTLFENAFKTRLKVAHASFIGTETKALIPAGLDLVSGISGFDQTSKMKPHFKMVDANFGEKVTSQKEIKRAYGFDPVHGKGISGKGQQIAIATYDGFHLDDIQDFFKKSKIDPAPAVDQVTFNGSPSVKEDSAAETALDAEFSGMLAPGAKIHVFASNENSDAGEVALFTAILDDNRAKIVNYSWGTCETKVTADHQAAMDKLYARAAAQGVTILVASGDSGADGCGDGTKVADWPATQPYALAVGGTTFGVDSAKKIHETAWNNGGGGVSQLYDLPDYQSNFQSPYHKRSMPDVSFNADQKTGEQIWTRYPYGFQHWLTIGGTSMAAPQWAGFIALVNEAREQAGKSSIGFVNPILYGMPASMNAAAFHDITSGSNGYEAGPGWDAATGLGSMQADTLLEYLTQQ